MSYARSARSVGRLGSVTNEERQSMEPDKFPKGDVYLIGSDVNDPIVILSGTESFSIRVSVKNCSTVTWDTSEQLRLAVWLLETSPQVYRHSLII